MSGGSRLHLGTILERCLVLSVALHRIMYVAQRLLQKIQRRKLSRRAVACQAWTRKGLSHCHLQRVLLAFCRSEEILWSFCNIVFTHSYSRESSIERGSYSMAYYIAGHESERHHFMEDTSVLRMSWALESAEFVRVQLVIQIVCNRWCFFLCAVNA